jgi:hypothetical protein
LLNGLLGGRGNNNTKLTSSNAAGFSRFMKDVGEYSILLADVKRDLDLYFEALDSFVWTTRLKRGSVFTHPDPQFGIFSVPITLLANFFYILVL